MFHGMMQDEISCQMISPVPIEVESLSDALIDGGATVEGTVVPAARSGKRDAPVVNIRRDIFHLFDFFGLLGVDNNFFDFCPIEYDRT